MIIYYILSIILSTNLRSGYAFDSCLSVKNHMIGPKDRIGLDPLQVGLTPSILATREQLKTKGNQTLQGLP